MNFSSSRFILLLATLAFSAPLVPAAEPTTTPDLTAAILTPPSPPEPRIHAPARFGVHPGHPVLFTIPATGDRPLTFSADNLPPGLSLDPATGILTGLAPATPAAYPITLHATNSRGSSDKPFSLVVGDTLALTPPMGWNTYYAFRINISDALVRKQTDALLSTGLINHGFSTISIDEGWNNRPGSTNPAYSNPPRASDGSVLPNPAFPDMKSLCDYIHAKGLKAGIYSSPGPLCCGGSEGSYQHEDQDAATYANWGFDYVKYDWCFYSRIAQNIRAEQYAKLLPAQSDALHALLADKGRIEAIRPRTPDQSAQLNDVNKKLQDLYAQMDPVKKKAVDLAIAAAPYKQFAASLAKTNRDLLFSLCQYGVDNVSSWGAEAGGNAWRTSTDIIDSWPRMCTNGFGEAGLEKFAGPGHWNDPDILMVGTMAKNIPCRLTPDEQYTHLSLWCLLSAPLLIGGDLTKLDPFSLNLLTNDEVLAIDQDPLGQQASRISQNGSTEIWSKKLDDGSFAIGLFNRGPSPVTLAPAWQDLHLPTPHTLRDLWRQQNFPLPSSSFLIPSHGVKLLRLIP